MENEDINNNKNDKSQNYSNIIFNPINQKNDNNQIDELNNKFGLLRIDDNNHTNQNKYLIREENSSLISISPEIKRKFEEYVDDNLIHN